MLSLTTQAARLSRPCVSLPDARETHRPYLGGTRCFTRNAEIFGEDEPATHVYRVVSGAVRAFTILHDGRRQITAFYLPGDLFGLEVGSNHLNSTEAICESQISVMKLCAASGSAPGSVDPAVHLWPLFRNELRRMQDHMKLLVRGAEERVAHFLLEMSHRTGDQASVILPMSRQDIADYLGITIETVSRTLTHFEQTGLIALRTSRQVDLCKRSTPRAAQGVRDNGSAFVVDDAVDTGP